MVTVCYLFSLLDAVNGKIKQKAMPAMGEKALANVIGRDWVKWSAGSTFDRVLRKGLSEEGIFEQRPEGRARRRVSHANCIAKAKALKCE